VVNPKNSGMSPHLTNHQTSGCYRHRKKAKNYGSGLRLAYCGWVQATTGVRLACCGWVQVMTGVHLACCGWARATTGVHLVCCGWARATTGVRSVLVYCGRSGAQQARWFCWVRGRYVRSDVLWTGE
jgi:hypothetical protein